MKTLLLSWLCWLDIHWWTYFFSNKHDGNFRECKICKKQQTASGVDLRYKINK